MKIIKLTQGLSTRVDDWNYDLLMNCGNGRWHAAWNPAARTFYAVTGQRKEKKWMHREIMRIYDYKFVVDHIDHDGLNNLEENLRVCTYQQNQWNSRKHDDNRTGYKGIEVYGRRYIARIWVDGKKINLGVYSTAIEAAEAYDRGALYYYGEFAYLNFPKNK